MNSVNDWTTWLSVCNQATDRSSPWRPHEVLRQEMNPQIAPPVIG